MFKKYNNEELLRLMALEDAGAFEEIYLRHVDGMFVYALNILKKKEVCEDIIQNIFIDLWSKRKDQEITNLPSYLFRAVKFQIFKYLRDNKLSSENLKRLNIIDVSMNISQKMEYDELEKIIHSYIAKLPNRCQQIFVLSRFQHKSNKEIADELGISMQAVKNQISKALGFIRENLQQEELLFLFLLFFR